MKNTFLNSILFGIDKQLFVQTTLKMLIHLAGLYKVVTDFSFDQWEWGKGYIAEKGFVSGGYNPTSCENKDLISERF